MHYIKVLSYGEEDDSNLVLGMDMLDQTKGPKVEASLGSIIASLHGVKEYLMLMVVGEVGG